jgi:dephospho-CoA kinase
VTDSARVLLGGGIGSGKSAAAAFWSMWGAAVLSADRAAHRVLEPEGSAAAAVSARWPGAVVEGRIDRRTLAAIVFRDATALAELESLTHPAIARLLAEEVAGAAAPVVVVEIPLPIELLGSGWRWVVVDAPDRVRLARLEARGMGRDEALRRMGAQSTRGEWLARAELVVDNGGDLAHLETECRWAWGVMLGW